MKGIADTGFLVAFARSRDMHHNWATRVAEEVTEPLLTCEAVLAETAFHLNNVGIVLEMIGDELVRLSFDCNDHLPQLADLAKRYADRQPDLADLCLIRMSELYPHHRVITADKDFRVYRRNKREVIPLICPPESELATGRVRVTRGCEAKGFAADTAAATTPIRVYLC
jgi:uncharacterized protein